MANRPENSFTRAMVCSSLCNRADNLALWDEDLDIPSQLDITNTELFDFLFRICSGNSNLLYILFHGVVHEALMDSGGKQSFKSEFDKLTKDFDRVCFLLKAIERLKMGKGGKALGLPGKGELELIVEGKSDAMARKCLEWCAMHSRSKQYESAINAANRAYFCALSRNVKFTVLQTRCRLFLEMGYYKECLYDAISALEASIEQRTKWSCIHPEPPENLTKNSGKISKKDKNEQQPDTPETPIQLLSAKEGVLRAKNTKSDRGWTLEVTRNVSVGFCSKECAENARNPDRSLLDGGPGRHGIMMVSTTITFDDGSVVNVLICQVNGHEIHTYQ
ncbi:hypothetical protein ACTXT7_010752 [Hymenolepis weldensis]